MILNCDGFYIVEAGGLSVYVDHACWHEYDAGSVSLKYRGGTVGVIYVDDKGAKSRIKELEKAGILRS
jgi:hypothetical protein